MHFLWPPGLSIRLKVPILFGNWYLASIRGEGNWTSQAVQVAAFSISAKIVDTVLLLVKSDTVLMVVSDRATTEVQIGKTVAKRLTNCEIFIMTDEME